MTVAFINRLPVLDADGRAIVVDSAPSASDPYLAGIRFVSADNSLYILTGAVPTDASFQDGFARDTSTGRLCALIDDPPSVGSRYYNDGILGDAAGHMCLTALNAIASYQHGWPVDSIGQVCVTGSTPPPPTDVSSFGSGLLLLDTIGLYTHTSGSGLGTLASPLDFTVSDISFTARITAVSPAASDDSGALGPAAAINHAQFCTDVDSDAFCSADSRTNANNAFGVFSSLTPSPNDPVDDPAFSYSDQNCGGEILASAGSPLAPTALMQAGAASNLVQADDSSPATGTATAINTLILDLSPQSNIDLDINFNAAEYLEAFLNASGLSTATATMVTEIKVNSGAELDFDWFPDGTTGALSPGGASLICPFTLNDTAAVAAPGVDFTGASLGVRNAAARFKASLPTLFADVEYTLTIVTQITITSLNSP